MDMDSFLQANLGPLLEAVDIADVLVIGFSTFAERLLVDPRTTSMLGPYVRVVQPVSNVEERVRELRALRPGLPDPERFVFFVWPRSVGALVELGVWERVLGRLRSAEHPAGERDAQRALRELVELEHAEIVAAIQGTRYRTLWERKG